MSTTPRIVADFETQLSTAIAAGSTTFSIASVLDDDGNTIPNGSYCVTVDNGSSGKEYLLGTMTDGNFTAVYSISRQGVATSGAVRAHRVGASVIITDFIAIKRVADILAGTDTLDGTSPLSYDTAPTLSDGKQLATVAYVLSIVTGGTVYFSSQTLSQTAGETLVAGTWVYFKEADQRWWKATSATLATYSNVKLGVTQSGASAGGSIVIQISGIAAGFSALTPGTKYYLSTAGAMTSSVGDTFLGTAVSSTTVLMDVNQIHLPSKDEKTFLGGVTGMFFAFGGSAAPTGFLLCDGSAVSRTTYAALYAVIGTAYGVGDGATTFNLPDFRDRTLIGAGTETKVATFASRSSDTITVTGLTNAANNEFQTGQAVVYHYATTAITGLVQDTTYYLIRISNTSFKLASSLANAQNGTAISLSSDGSGAQTFTMTLTTRALGDTGGEENHAISLTETLSHSHDLTVKTSTAGSGSTRRPASNDSNPETTTSITGASGSAIQSTGGNAAMNNMQPFGVVNWLVKT